MIRVLSTIVVPPHMTVSGGARAGELLSAALSRYCDVSVASMMNGQGVALDGSSDHTTRVPVSSWLPPVVPWSRLPGRYRTLFYRSSLPQVIARGTFDIVHIHNPMPAMEMWRVARAARAARIPVVVSTHGFNEVANGTDIYGFGPARRLMWRTLVQRPVAAVVREAAAIFALSEADFDIVRGMGYSGETLTVVTNGVTIPAASDPGADALALKRLGIERGDRALTCMFLANHTPNKGLPVLLEAFSQLDRPFVLMVGGEKRADVDYDAYVRRCKPGQRIVITGRLSDDDVAAAFRSADLFVYPTLADTFPLVVLEAMSHGVPVIASRVGGIPHQIDDSCGVIVEPRHVEGLRAAIDRLAAAPRDRLTRMGEAARQRVAERFSWDSAARAAIAGYRRVLGLAPADVQPRRVLRHKPLTGIRPV